MSNLQIIFATLLLTVAVSTDPDDDSVRGWDTANQWDPMSYGQRYFTEKNKNFEILGIFFRKSEQKYFPDSSQPEIVVDVGGESPAKKLGQKIRFLKPI